MGPSCMGPINTQHGQEASLRGLDSAYCTLSLTTKPLLIARSSTKDIYRWRVMPDFAARASRRFTSLAVRRTVTGLAVSVFGGIVGEHEDEDTSKLFPLNRFRIALVIVK
jgi:hypothetical protein